MEIKGECKDCLFGEQAWTVVEDKRTKQLKKVIDLACSICDVFKRPDGYCDYFEPRERQ